MPKRAPRGEQPGRLGCGLSSLPSGKGPLLHCDESVKIHVNVLATLRDRNSSQQVLALGVRASTGSACQARVCGGATGRLSAERVLGFA